MDGRLTSFYTGKQLQQKDLPGCLTQSGCGSHLTASHPLPTTRTGSGGRRRRWVCAPWDSTARQGVMLTPARPNGAISKACIFPYPKSCRADIPWLWGGVGNESRTSSNGLAPPGLTAERIHVIATIRYTRNPPERRARIVMCFC